MAPRIYVEAPPVTPLPFGLFSTATVIDDPSPRWLFGTEYQPDNCGDVYDTAGACTPLGTLTVEVDAARGATLTSDAATGLGSYTVAWGDGETDTVPGADLNGSTHTYAADGTYDVTVTGPRGYSATVTDLAVTNGATTAATDATVSTGDKTTTEGLPDLVLGEAFAVYHNFVCRPVGTDLLERARAALRLGEGRAVERVWAQQMASTATDVTPTPGTPLDLVDGLALLEQYAAENYGGVPVLHVPRGATTRLAAHGAVDRYGTRIETPQGAFVASGGGYTGESGPGADATAGQAWLYVTGQVTVRRAPVIEATAIKTSGAGASNDFRALVERPYVVTSECVSAAVLVNNTFAGGA
ncbi:hypothetical protein Pam4_23 [Pseudanabaena phage Pam4]|nr:hypothetical protein Pam4_23 [Pseudanabaena phage Pam4]